MQKILLLIFLTIFSFNIFAQDFEGEIKIIRKTFSDTIYFNCFIKNELLRLDELNKNKNAIRTLIVNLKMNTIIVFAYQKKLYKKLNPDTYINIEDENFEIKKTENFREIHAYDCYQIRVKNKVEETEITYWVAPNFYSHIFRVLKLLNKQKKEPNYFLQIPEIKGGFPFLVVERNLIRTERSRIEISEIIKKKLPKTIFEVPKDYKYFED